MRQNVWSHTLRSALWVMASNIGCKTALSAQVLLPVAADVTVSDEVFKRSGGELQRDWQRARERREQGEVLMTRATREKLAAKKKRHHCFARVRVRFPEGIILQGALQRGGTGHDTVHSSCIQHRAVRPSGCAL